MYRKAHLRSNLITAVAGQREAIRGYQLKDANTPRPDRQLLLKPSIMTTTLCRGVRDTVCAAVSTIGLGKVYSMACSNSLFDTCRQLFVMTCSRYGVKLDTLS